MPAAIITIRLDEQSLAALRANTAACNRVLAALVAVEEKFMATITEVIQQFQVAADQAHADSTAERDVTDRAIQAMTDLEHAPSGASLTDAQNQAIAGALAELGSAHNELAQRVRELGPAADTAEGAANPPPPPAP
jgi:hypothetical protein